MSLQHFRYYAKEDVLRLTRLRRFETKVGEQVQVSTGSDLATRLQSSAVDYVLFGIPENIGVKANSVQQAQRLPLPQINCINLDAHTDYRPEEGRHSGNAFRYAESDGFLQKYCVVGIHENYLPQNVWVDFVNNPFFDCLTYEDIF